MPLSLFISPSPSSPPLESKSLFLGLFCLKLHHVAFEILVFQPVMDPCLLQWKPGVLTPVPPGCFVSLTSPDLFLFLDATLPPPIPGLGYLLFILQLPAQMSHLRAACPVPWTARSSLTWAPRASCLFPPQQGAGPVCACAWLSDWPSASSRRWASREHGVCLFLSPLCPQCLGHFFKWMKE